MSRAHGPTASLCLMLLLAPASQARPAATAAVDSVVRRTQVAFGVEFDIVAHAASTDALSASVDAAIAEVVRIEGLLDETRDDAPIARINAKAGDAAVVLDPEVFFVLAEAQRIATLSNGNFDLTAVAYDAVWDFRAPAPDAAAVTGARAAKKETLDKPRARVGFADLLLDPTTRSARLRLPGASIGLGAFARAYALQKAAELLLRGGLRDFIVSAGGDLVVAGQKATSPWMIGVRDPRAPGHFAAIAVSDAALGRAVATSADYEAYFFEDGVRYHSLLDPHTGQPARLCRSVTVVANDALTAQAVSRAAFVLGDKEGAALVSRLGLESIIVTTDNRVLISKGLRASVTSRPPTDGP